jgi:hypothetical protein
MSNDARLHVLHRNPLWVNHTSLNPKQKIYVWQSVLIATTQTLKTLLLRIYKYKQTVPYLHTYVVRTLSTIATCLHTIYFIKYQQQSSKITLLWKYCFFYKTATSGKNVWKVCGKYFNFPVLWNPELFLNMIYILIYIHIHIYMCAC